VEIDFEVFQKIVKNNTCLKDEILRCFLGIEGSVREMQERGLLVKKGDNYDDDEDEGPDKVKEKVVDVGNRSICKVIDK
jgi:hypothetical protein